MDRKIKCVIIFILICINVLFFIGCNLKRLSGVDIRRPTTDNIFSIYYNKNPTNMIPSSSYLPIRLRKMTVEELANTSYVYVGYYNDRRKMYYFIKSGRKFIVYSSSINNVLYPNEAIYLMYEKRTILPTSIETNGIGEIESMSVNPVFYKMEYDNYMDTNFRFNLPDIPSAVYERELTAYKYSLKRSGVKGFGLPIGNVETDKLERTIVGSGNMWVNMFNENTEASDGNRYIFYDGRRISTAVSPATPSKVPDKYKGWDIWPLKDIGKEGVSNYVYVYDNVKVLFENLGGGTNYMFFYNTDNVNTQPDGMFVRLNVVP